MKSNKKLIGITILVFVFLITSCSTTNILQNSNESITDDIPSSSGMTLSRERHLGYIAEGGTNSITMNSGTYTTLNFYKLASSNHNDGILGKTAGFDDLFSATFDDLSFIRPTSSATFRIIVDWDLDARGLEEFETTFVTVHDIYGHTQQVRVADGAIMSFSSITGTVTKITVELDYIYHVFENFNVFIDDIICFWRYENRLPTTSSGWQLKSGSAYVTSTLRDLSSHTWTDPDYRHSVSVYGSGGSFSKIYDSVTQERRWKKNNNVQYWTGSAIFNTPGTNDKFKKYNTIHCEVRGYDGYDNGNWYSSSGEYIYNSAPYFSSTYDYDLVTANDYVGDTYSFPTNLGGEYRDYDVDDSPFVSNYRWYKNGAIVPGLTTPSVIPKDNGYVKGNTIKQDFRISDGTAYSVYRSSEPITIVNTPPLLSNLSLNGTIWAELGEVQFHDVTWDDDDGDTSTDPHYQWWINSDGNDHSDAIEIVGATSNILSHSDTILTYGNFVWLEYWDNDGDDYSNHVWKSIAVSNTLPEISGQIEFLSSDDPYAYINSEITYDFNETTLSDDNSQDLQFYWELNQSSIILDSGTTFETTLLLNLSLYSLYAGDTVNLDVYAFDGEAYSTSALLKSITLDNKPPSCDSAWLSYSNELYMETDFTISYVMGEDIDGDNFDHLYIWYYKFISGANDVLINEGHYYDTLISLEDIDLGNLLSNGDQIYLIAQIIDDGSPGNPIDINFGNATDLYTIVGFLPFGDSPNDMSYFYNTIDHYINWSVSDSNPYQYQLFIDSVGQGANIWDGNDLSLNIDGLSLGTHNVTLWVCGIEGNWAQDQVNVDVELDPNDIPGIPGYAIGTLSIIFLIGVIVSIYAIERKR